MTAVLKNLFPFFALTFVACTNGSFVAGASGGGGEPSGVSLTPAFVIGQNSFYNTSSASAANRLAAPNGIFIVEDKLVVADRPNNRVLIWDPIPTASGASASLVVGQTNFTNNAANMGGSTSSTSLASPRGVFVLNDSPDLLYVADGGNNRVVIYVFPTVDTPAGFNFIGQSADNTSGSGNTANALSTPISATVAGGQLFVSDLFNNRVLIYANEAPGTDANANAVLGNSAFGAQLSGTSATRFSTVGGIAEFGGTFFMADQQNARVLRWDATPFTTEAPATEAIGQPDLITGTDNTGNVQDHNFSQPLDITYNGTYYFVVDYTGHRVLVYDVLPGTGVSAKYVAGQPDFNSSSPGSGTTGLNGPRGVAATATQLFVADSGNNRIVVYDLP